jgi:DNA-binding XRE family transcriptional regulator
MKGRCYDPNDKRWKDYGGRGITVCERWRLSVTDFIKDMGDHPGPEYSLDRINNNGNYEPGNCRWATRVEQARNTRQTKANKLIVRAIRILREHDGFTYDALAEMLSLKRMTVAQIATGRNWKWE